MACDKQKTPRSAKTIATYCGVRANSILKVEKEHGAWAANTSASSFVDTLGQFLQVPYYVRQLCVELLQRTEHCLQGRKLDTIAAAALFVVTRKFCESCMHDFPTPNLRKWGRQLNIPFRSIQSIVKLFPSFRVQSCGGFTTPIYALILAP